MVSAWINGSKSYTNSQDRNAGLLCSSSDVLWLAKYIRSKIHHKYGFIQNWSLWNTEWEWAAIFSHFQLKLCIRRDTNMVLKRINICKNVRSVTTGGLVPWGSKSVLKICQVLERNSQGVRVHPRCLDSLPLRLHPICKKEKKKKERKGVTDRLHISEKKNTNTRKHDFHYKSHKLINTCMHFTGLPSLLLHQVGRLHQTIPELPRNRKTSITLLDTEHIHTCTSYDKWVCWEHG